MNQRFFKTIYLSTVFKVRNFILIFKSFYELKSEMDMGTDGTAPRISLTQFRDFLSRPRSHWHIKVQEKSGLVFYGTGPQVPMFLK